MRREYPPFYQSTSGKHVPPGTTPLECFGINGCTRKPVIQNKSSTLREGWIGNSSFNKCTDLNWNDPLLSSNVGSAEIEEDSIEFCSGCKRKKLYCKNIYITSISLFHRLFIIHVKSWQWRIIAFVGPVEKSDTAPSSSFVKLTLALWPIWKGTCCSRL